MNGLCVLQHTEGEFLGLMEDHFESRSIRFTYVRPFVPGAKVPDGVADFSGLVLLGAGPRGVVTGDLLPSLAPELRLTRAFLAAGRPVVGIGLGSAILAIASGGGAEAAPLRFMVGVARRTTPDALAGHLPESFPIAVYGRDKAVPPQEARLLAEDETGNPVVYQVANNCLGFAGHPGVKRAMIEDLVMEFAETPEDIADGLGMLTTMQRPLAEALTTIMVGLVKVTGLMRAE